MLPRFAKTDLRHAALGNTVSLSYFLLCHFPSVPQAPDLQHLKLGQFRRCVLLSALLLEFASQLSETVNSIPSVRHQFEIVWTIPALVPILVIDLHAMRDESFFAYHPYDPMRSQTVAFPCHSEL